MTSEMPKHPLSDWISKEHAWIEQKLKQFWLTDDAEKRTLHFWQSLYWFCTKDIEENHHQKEEDFIFKKIADDPRLLMGGPYCTYYFDLFLQNRPAEFADRLVKKWTGKTFQSTPNAFHQMVSTKNLPLAIPLEDHESGRRILKGMGHLNLEIKNNEGKPNETQLEALKNLFLTYWDIQKSHFLREENCFIILCQELVSIEEWQGILLAMHLQMPILGAIEASI